MAVVDDSQVLYPKIPTIVVASWESAGYIGVHRTHTKDRAGAGEDVARPRLMIVSRVQQSFVEQEAWRR